MKKIEPMARSGGGSAAGKNSARASSMVAFHEHNTPF
jgi:hypothetical protein